MAEEESSRTQSVNLSNEQDPNSADYLKIEISDALNEKDKVKFTVKTKVDILRRYKYLSTNFIYNRHSAYT